MLKIVIRSIRICLVSLLTVVAVRAAAQNPPSDKPSSQFLHEAEALRSKLEPLQTTLSSFDVDQLKMSEDGLPILDKLKKERGMCSHFIQSLGRNISLLENSAQKFPALEHLNQEVTVMWGVVHLENCIIKLRSDWELAQSSATASRLAGFNDATSVHLQEWLSELRNIASNGSPTDLGAFHDRLESQLMMHLGTVESELSQCRGPRPQTLLQNQPPRVGHEHLSKSMGQASQ